MLKEQRLIVEAKGDIRILAVGDTHHPFADQAKLKNLYALAKDLRPTHIVQIGDLYDLYTFSRFSRSVDLITPKQELEAGRAGAQTMWGMLQSIVPKAACYQLRGNHSFRIVKRMLDHAPEFESLLDGPISKLTEFDGVTDMKSHRSELEINGIVFAHGWSCRPGSHRDYFGQSTVVGHSHHGGVVYRAQKGLPLFELNAGHVADVKQLPLQYNDSTTSSWVAGAGVIDKYGPRFCPL